jgi:hypothetical protein
MLYLYFTSGGKNGGENGRWRPLFEGFNGNQNGKNKPVPLQLRTSGDRKAHVASRTANLSTPMQHTGGQCQ